MTTQLERQYNISTFSFLIFDADNQAYRAEEKLKLERHYNDLYALFMKKTTAYLLTNIPDNNEEKTLKGMLSELIAIKTLLARED